VRGWDDPRLPTLNGYCRKGYRSSALIDFCERVGITPAENLIEVDLLEFCVRQDLDGFCDRGMVVIHPLKVVLSNYGDEIEELDAPNHPAKKERGTHKIFFSKVIYIEKSDFRLNDSPDYYGLAPNKEVGLRHAYNITCTEVIEKGGEVVEIHATVDKQKLRKPKGHIHFVARPATDKEPQRAEVRLYDHLFMSPDPSTVDDWVTDINPNSLVIAENAFIDSFVAGAKVNDKFQFERLGFFCKDPDSTDSHPVWNRTVTLKDSFNKVKPPKSDSKKN